jgi:hypothetical protein
MLRVAPSTASRIVRRGFSVSSARGVEPSKPPNARIVKTEPAMTALRVPSGACDVLNTLRVLALPAWNTSSTPSTTNTPTSKMPSTVPRRAEARIPYRPAAITMSAPRIVHGHHRSAG